MLEQQQYVRRRSARRCANISPRARRNRRISNARSIRNALDRARLRQANRLFERRAQPLSPQALSRIEPEDFRASRVFDAPAGAP